MFKLHLVILAKITHVSVEKYCLWVTLKIYQGLLLPFCKLMLALLKEVNCILLEVNIYKNLAINTIIFMGHYTIMIMLSFNNSRLIIIFI